MQRGKIAAIRESHSRVLTWCQLATLMHGSIGLESKPNVGSKATFSVQFRRPPNRRPSRDISGLAGGPLQGPLILEADPNFDREARPLRRLSPGVGDGITVSGIQPKMSKTARARTQVLVVEDNTINQHISVQIIKKLGFPVHAVWNGKEALEYLANPTIATPRPHIVIMDCQMPIMDGYEATRQLRNSSDVPIDESLRKIPVIALTASAIKGDREKCEAAGMDDYITKPAAKQDLERILVKWALRSQSLER
jgi:CheY-like chemotaxis protein